MCANPTGKRFVQTVEHFSGRRVTRDLIQNYKDQGGWNNDWALSQRILRDLGVEVEYETVVELFNGSSLEKTEVKD
jgi:hypothetical protein